MSPERPEIHNVSRDQWWIEQLDGLGILRYCNDPLPVAGRIESDQFQQAVTALPRALGLAAAASPAALGATADHRVKRMVSVLAINPATVRNLPIPRAHRAKTMAHGLARARRGRKSQAITKSNPRDQRRALLARFFISHIVPQAGALVAAATLSHRYITDRFLPDKAIDLMDEAASRLRMEVDSKPEELDALDRQILQFQIESEALKKEDDKASKDRLEKLQKELAEKH